MTKKRCEEISGLLENALIEQLNDERPAASVLQVARMYLRDNHHVAATRPESRLHVLQDEVAKRLPFQSGS